MRDTSQIACWDLATPKTPILIQRKIGEQRSERIVNLSDMHGLPLLWAIDILPIKACHLWHHQPLCFNFICVSLYVGGTLQGSAVRPYTHSPELGGPSFFFSSFSSGFAQGHDTFLRGFGSRSLFLQLFNGWLADEVRPRIKQICGHMSSDYTNTLLALISSAHPWRCTIASWKWGAASRGWCFYAELSHTACTFKLKQQTLVRGNLLLLWPLWNQASAFSGTRWSKSDYSSFLAESCHSNDGAVTPNKSLIFIDTPSSSNLVQWSVGQKQKKGWCAPP